MLLGASIFIWQVLLAIFALREQSLTHLNSQQLLLSLFLFALCYVLQFWAWWALMRSLGVALPVIGSFQGYFLSFLPRYIPGSVWGYLGRGEWLFVEYKTPYHVTNLGSLLEAAFFLCTAGVWVLVNQIGNTWNSNTVLLALLLGCVTVGWLAHLILRRSSYGNGSRITFSILGAASVLYGIYWLVQGMAVSVLIFSLGIASPLMGFLSVTSAVALAWSIGFLSIFVPAGLGIREASLALILSQQISFTSHDAALIAVLSRAGLVTAELLIITLTFVLKFWIASKPPSQSISL